MATKIKIRKFEDAVDDILEFLLQHEGDIAAGINYFGTLQNAFTVLLGREPDAQEINQPRNPTTH